MRKKFISFLAAVCLTVQMISPAFADIQQGDPSVKESPEIKIVIDGKSNAFATTPILIKDRVLLPLRDTFTSLGVPNDDQHIRWNESERSVTVKNDANTLYLTIDSTTANVNGKPVTLDVPAVIYGDRAYVPARFVSQSLGKKVVWDELTNSVIIRDEAALNETKAILEKALAATDSLEKYKQERAVDVTVQYKTAKSTNKTSASYKIDLKNNTVSAAIDTNTSIGNVAGKNEKMQIWYDGNAAYTRKEGETEWKKGAVPFAQAKSQLDLHQFLEAADNVYAGLKPSTDPVSGDIVLSGNISTNGMLGLAFKSANADSLRVKNTALKVVIEKSSNYIKQINLECEGSFAIGNENYNFTLTTSIIDSDFNGNFPMERPKELEAQTGSAVTEYKAGKDLVQAGETEEAIAHFDKAIQADPKYLDAYKGKAVALYLLGEYKKSNEVLDKADGIDPKDDEVFALKARNYILLKDLDKALELCEKSISINPKNEFAYVMKVRALQRKAKYSDALEAANKALEINPRYEDAYVAKVSTLYTMKNYDACIDAAAKAQVLFPKNEDIPWYKADCYVAQYKYEEAIQAYEQVLKINPANSSVWTYMGEQYYYLQKYDKAMDCVTKALGIDKEDEYALGLKKAIEEAQLPEAQRVVNFVKRNYLYYDKVQDFDQKSADLLSKQNVSAEDITKFIDSIRQKDDPFTYVISGKYYDQLMEEENSRQIYAGEMDSNTYFIRINRFTQSVSADFKKAIDSIPDPGSKALIIDVRDNGGGLIAASNEILDLLLAKCVTSFTIDRQGYMRNYYSDENQVKFKKIIVLVNENSASSSELLALGLKKYLSNVVIIGHPTVGKGVGQNVFENKEGKYMILLVNFYWNVKEQNIAGGRIVPDITVQGSTEEDYKNEVKKQLN